MGPAIGRASLKTLIALFFFLPCLVHAGPTVLVDAIPSAGVFFGSSAVGLPFHDAEKADVKQIEAGLASVISGVMPYAEQNEITYICLLSAPGDDPVGVLIPATNSELKLRRKNSAVTVVFYRGGHDSAAPVTFSTDRPQAKKTAVSMSFKMIAVPPGVTTAGWIYFNLSRIQDEAAKAGSAVAFLEAGGTGAIVPVAIPGMKEPLMVFSDQTTFTATWYADPKKAAAAP